MKLNGSRLLLIAVVYYFTNNKMPRNDGLFKYIFWIFILKNLFDRNFY